MPRTTVARKNSVRRLSGLFFQTVFVAQPAQNRS